MIRRIFIALAALVYLWAMAYYAFRPFIPIRGVQYAPAELEWKDGAIHLQRDAALEIRSDVDALRTALIASGQLSLELLLRTDRLQQDGSPLIVAYGQSCFNQNFSVAQDGNGIEFRLRTSDGDNYGLHPSFLIPRVFDADLIQHVVITYNGLLTRLYIDGALRAETADLSGNFDNWGHNHTLTLGDEPPGGDAWFGYVWHFSLYDRALDADEIRELYQGGKSAGALLAFDFGANPGFVPEGLKELRYRNLFVTTDPAAYELSDCIFNVIGFVPLGVLAYMILPLRMERRKILAGVLVPLLVGFVASSSIEVLQRYVFMRVPCVPDLVYNTTGSLLGGLLAWLSFSTFKNKTTNGSDT